MTTRTRAAVPASMRSHPPRGRPRSNDLRLELFRQQTLLQVMAARMRETAAGLDGGFSVGPERLARAADVHARFLLEVHRTDDARILAALAEVPRAPTRSLARQVAEDLQRAEEFQQVLARAIAKGAAPTGGEARRLANLFRDEADRIDRHQAREVEGLDDRLDAWLSPDRRRQLLAEMRAFDSARVDAEVALVSWAAQIHPSSD